MKLSEAGRLYLQDYYILDEARKDVDRFIGEILEETFSRLNEEAGNFSDDVFNWQLWVARSSPGYFSISSQYKKDGGLFRKGKDDIYITYQDVRRCNDLKKTDSIKIEINTSSIFKRNLKKFKENNALKLEEALKEIADKDTPLDFNKKVHYELELKIDLNDSDNSIVQITDLILEKWSALDEFVRMLVR